MSTPLHDKARGTLIGAAVGDALGVPYEFGVAPLGLEGPQLIGGGLGDFEPGEWSDDTAMTWAVADAAATTGGLHTPTQLDTVAQHFRRWYESKPPDVGRQTRAVLAGAGASPTAEKMTAAAAEYAAHNPRSSGNGSLMRTSPVALPYLEDPARLTAAALAVGALTHNDDDAQDACVLWSHAIRTAIVEDRLDLRGQIQFLPDDKRDVWLDRIDAAEADDPRTFRKNGWSVEALQASWSVLYRAREENPATAWLSAVSAAIAIGEDTDTVASITGALAGAFWGAQAIPAELVQQVFGYPGLTASALGDLAAKIL